MTFDFGALPPEINSIRMYTGAGAGPMMAAAAAFSSLADELSTTASASQSAISNLTGEEWMGPSSVAMVTAAEPYVLWMHTTAGQLQQAAAQAMASAAAYEAAFAMTVPPPVVAANRAQLAALVATNVLGQNTPAIVATEAQYGEMWAQDAAAMYGYAASSAAAARLSPLTSPAPTNSPGGLGVQTAATAAQTSGLRGVVSNVPNAVQSFAAPAAAPDPPGLPGLSTLDSILGDPVVNQTGNAVFDVGSWNIFNTIVSNILYNHTLDTAASAGAAASGVEGAVGGGALVSAAAPVSTAGVGTAPVLANMGAAAPVGGLSTPAAWSAATPRVPAETVASTGWTAPAEEMQTTWASGMPAVASAGRGGGYGMGPRYGVKPKVMPTRLLV